MFDRIDSPFVRRVGKWLWDHPRVSWGLAAFWLFFIFLPGIFNIWWYSFLNEPPIPTLAKKMNWAWAFPTFHFSATWITGSIGIVMLILIAYLLIVGKQASKLGVLEIVFKPEPPFVMDYPGGRVFRVGVTSTANAIVRVMVEKATFDGVVTPNLYLRITNDQTGKKNQTELHKGVTVYWDVVEKFSHGGGIQLRHVVQGLPHALGDRSAFRIIASSNKGPASAKWVAAELDGNNQLQFQLCNNEEDLKPFRSLSPIAAVETADSQKELLQTEGGKRLPEVNEDPQVDFIYRHEKPYRESVECAGERRLDFYIGVRSSISVKDLVVEIDGYRESYPTAHNQPYRLHKKDDDPPFKPMDATDPESGEMLFSLATVFEPTIPTASSFPRVILNTNEGNPKDFPYGQFSLIVRGSNILARKRRIGFRTPPPYGSPVQFKFHD